MVDVIVQVILYLSLLLFLALSAFFSGSEIAIAQANRSRMNKKAESGDKKARAALTVMDRFTETISTILFSNNLVNIAFTSVSTLLAVTFWFPGAYTADKEALVTLGLTFAVLVFGEILPKILCAEHADGVALGVARPIRFFSMLFRPVVRSVTWIIDRIARLWKKEDEGVSATTDELQTMVDEIQEEGLFTPKEGDLIRSAIDFSETQAREVMIPRVDVEGFDLDGGTVEDLKKSKDLLSYARFPVYRESMDNVVGILSSKRFIHAVMEGGEVDLESLLYEPVYVHMTRTISSILAEFRQKHLQMAIVIDEFGGTMGILTMEDILEEIVGEIYDERDEVEEDVVRRGSSFEVDGSANIEDVFEEIGFTDDAFESAYTTVGGWATEVLDKFPEKGDTFTYKALTVTVLEADEHRVEKLRIDVAEPEAEEDKEKEKEEN
ncbi:MAG: HlyC/CorC family transporter [Clostridia bacterium]|nr:HlyC/CorC family transporter [Clostridia bacterium]